MSMDVGLFAGRTLWNNEQYYRQPTSPLSLAHDVSLYGGTRVRGRLFGSELASEFVLEKRLNYLFQSSTYGYDVDRSFDMTSISIRVRVAIH